LWTVICIILVLVDGIVEETSLSKEKTEEKESRHQTGFESNGDKRYRDADCSGSGM